MIEQKTLLDEFFSLDPLSLTKEHIDAGIERYRRDREQFKLGKKEPKKEKVAVDLDTLEL